MPDGSGWVIRRGWEDPATNAFDRAIWLLKDGRRWGKHRYRVEEKRCVVEALGQACGTQGTKFSALSGDPIFYSHVEVMYWALALEFPLRWLVCHVVALPGTTGMPFHQAVLETFNDRKSTEWDDVRNLLDRSSSMMELTRCRTRS